MKLTLLYGGKSGEHEVSLLSAASVYRYLDKNKYDITLIGMDKEGRLYRHRDLDIPEGEPLPVSTKNSEPIASLIAHGRFICDTDVVFPVVHGPLYEDGALQGLLELANVPYVGPGVLSSALSMDKDMMRRVVSLAGIPTPRYVVISRYMPSEIRKSMQARAMDLHLPLFVKPCCLGSSVGISKVSDIKKLEAAMEKAWMYDDTILIEEGIVGREIEISVLEGEHPGDNPRVSLPGEICVHHKDGFYSYDAKYIETAVTELIAPAVLDTAVITRFQNMAAHIFTMLRGEGMSRIDFFYAAEADTIYFNEMNTIPGFTKISMYPRMWEASGLKYGALLDELVRLAISRHRRRMERKTSYA